MSRYTPGRSSEPWEKKRCDRRGPRGGAHGRGDSPLVAQYELLREATLGEPLPPEARSGLVLFLRRGMWAWARALADMKAPGQPSRSPSWDSTAAHQHRAAIALLATLVLTSNPMRAQ